MEALSSEFWEKEFKKSEKINDSDVTSEYFWEKELGTQAAPKLPVGAVIESGLVRKPETKKEIFAKARKIPESAYTSEKGKIYYTKEGRKYEEETSSLRDALIQAVTDPGTLMGIGGGLLANILAPGLGLPALAVIGVGSGIGGEYTRQRLADILYGEKTLPPEALEKLGMTGLQGVLGEGIGAAGKIVGRGAASLASRLMGSPKVPEKAVKILEKAGAFFPDYAKYVENVQNRARTYGIELNLIESAENPITLKQFEKLAQKNITEAIERAKTIENNIPVFIKRLFPGLEAKSSLTVNKQIKDLANEATNDLTKSRRKLTRPFYEAAFDKDPEPIIDTNLIAEYIDFLIDKSIPEHKVLLERLKENILPNMTLTQVDQFKRDIADPKLYKAGGEDWTIIKSELKEIKNLLVDEMDYQVPEYKTARAVHALLKEGAPRKKLAQEAGIEEKNIEKLIKIGEGLELSKTLLKSLTSKNFIKDVGQYILFSKNSTPETVSILKSRLLSLPGGKEAWNQTIAEFLKNKALQLKPSAEGTLNFGEQWWKSIFGDKQKQSIMKSALNSTQYKALSNFMDIMRRTGIVFKTNPSTNQLDMTPDILEATRKAARPFWSTGAVFGVKMVEFIRDKKNQDLINFIYDPNISKRLSDIKITGNIEKILYQLSRILGWGTVKND